MDGKPYINRPEWMENIQKSIDYMIKSTIRKHLGLSEDADTPEYTVMSVNEDRFKHETVFNVRVKTEPEISYIQVNLV